MPETESIWAARVAGWRASGEPVSAFCKGKGSSPSGLRYSTSRLAKSSRAVPLHDVRLARGTPSRREVGLGGLPRPWLPGRFITSMPHVENITDRFYLRGSRVVSRGYKRGRVVA